MKKIFFLSAIFTVLLVSCSNDEPEINANPGNPQNREITTNFTPEQQKLFSKLQQINDSIAACDFENNDFRNAETRVNVISWRRITKMDAKGLYDGFRFGWANGKGLFGKFATATINAAAFSVQYSFQELIRQISAPVWRPSGSLSTNDILLAMGAVVDSQELDDYVTQFIIKNPDVIETSTYDEIRMACIHNVVLSTIESGRVLPNGLINNLLSDDQKTYFNSYQYKRCFNAIPNIVSGTVNINLYCIDSFPIATKVIDMYGEGIDNIQSNSVPVIYNRLGSMCNEYVATVLESDEVEEDAKSHLISSLYVALLSLEHWSQIYN